MSGTFSGQLAVGDEQLDVDLQVSVETVRLVTGAAEIGQWPLHQIRVTPRGDGSYRMVVDDDIVDFHPDEPDTFGELVDFMFTGPNGTAAVAPASTSDDDDADVMLPGSAPTPPIPAGLPSPTPEAAGAERPPDVPDVGLSDEEPVGAGEETAPPFDPIPPETRAEEPLIPGLAVPNHEIPGDEVTEDEIGGGGTDEVPPEDEEEEAASSIAELLAPRYEDDEPDTAEELSDEPDDPEEPEPSPSSLIPPSERDEGSAIEGDSTAGLRERLSPSRFGRRALRVVGLSVAGLALMGVAALTGPSTIDAASSLLAGSTDSDPTPTTSTPTTAPAATDDSTVTSTTTTQAVAGEQVSASSGDGIFSQQSMVFVESWNRVGGRIADALRIDDTGFPPGPFSEPFTDYIRLTGQIGGDSIPERITLEIDPTGPTASDLLGIQTLGVAVAVANPELDGPGRAAFLARLGLDVDAPRLDGLDGQAVANGVDYRLVYDTDTGLIVFTLTPAG